MGVSPEASQEESNPESTTAARMTAADVGHRLRDAIVTGKLVPNQRLVEADLANEYGASRGNVRIALTELSSEGLIERVAHRGARVRAVSPAEAVEITEVRGALESLCARKAAERVSEAEIGQLREIGRRMSRAVELNDREAYSSGNKELHALIIEISGQQVAADTIQRLRGQAVRYQYRLAQKPGRPAESLPQHLAIIEGICTRDANGAADAMQAHLSNVAVEIKSTEDSA
ncbi:GntR family transcriptional regulator [Brevibacterium marinum]|uniref:DNA-binding GntR family transcriptional regulator n=1 Tax=Brevibacterium marinum TaxID=418643 RepID=A0A846S342_9MICO|nr:DNA-binding GntR family transcriptional regulator [Brevibacterium marinum]